MGDYSSIGLVTPIVGFIWSPRIDIAVLLESTLMAASQALGEYKILGSLGFRV